MEYRAGDTSTVYRYVTDAFEKITGLIDPDGNFAARYVYDGYGNCETRMAWTDMPDSTVAALNPFRYEVTLPTIGVVLSIGIDIDKK